MFKNYDGDEVLQGLLGNRERRWKFTVEIPMLVLLFSFSLTDSATYNLLLFRTCNVDLDHNATECGLLRSTNKTEDVLALENEVEVETTKMVMLLATLSGITPAILSLFLGPWSELYGRKPLLLWPLFGQVISSCLVILFSGIPVLSSWWYIACALPFPILGGGSTFGLGAYLLVADVTSEDDRSIRLAILQGCNFVGVLAGTLASNYIYYGMGPVFLFTISASLYLFTFYYVIYYVEETIKHPRPVPSAKAMLDWRIPRQMIQILRKHRPHSISIILSIVIFAYGTTTFCVSGVNNVDYLFTRENFRWILQEYNDFSAVRTTIVVIGMLFGIFFLQSYLKISDGILLTLSYLSTMSEATVTSVSEESWQLYFAAGLSFLGGLQLPLIKSQISKIVPKSEVSTLYSLLSCVEAIVPIFSPMLFSTTYFHTLSTHPGTIYFVSAGLYALCIILIIIAEGLSWKLPRDFNPNNTYPSNSPRNRSDYTKGRPCVATRRRRGF